MPEAADPVQEIAELRALLAEREAELAVARAELRDCQEFRAGLGMMGAKEPDHAATQRASYS